MVTVGQMWKFPTGEVLKFKNLCNGDNEFEARLFSLRKVWSRYYIKGSIFNLEPWLKEAGATLVNESDYPPEPDDET